MRCCCVCSVPSSSPVAVPARRRTSTSEEHPHSASMARAASTERSLLSQQIRVNSGSSLHSLNNHHAEAQLNTDPKTNHMDDSFPFATSNSPEASVPGHSSPPLLNGGTPGGLQGGLQEFMKPSTACFLMVHFSMFDSCICIHIQYWCTTDPMVEYHIC